MNTVRRATRPSEASIGDAAGGAWTGRFVARLASRLAVALAAAVATLVSAATAWAQEFEKVEGQVRENIPAAPFLAGAYGFIWLAVFVYVATVARRLSRVKDDIETLRRRVAAAPSAPGPHGGR